VSVTLRALTPADAEAAAGIYNEAVAKRLATFDESPSSAAEFEVELLTQLSTHPGVAIEEDGKLVAYALSSPHSQYVPYRTIAEFSVYVVEGRRSRGFGRMALTELVSRCKAAGFSKLLSRVMAHNGASRGLCVSLGFREVGTYERHARLDGVWRDVVIVEKVLEET
jgi:L-amino acid N-acyltransferase YncA